MDTMDSIDTLIPAVRRFNRFYTNILGLLNQHLLDSGFSLSEARVLYEIGNTEPCMAKKLIDTLRLDAGYLSRILKRFERKDLARRVQSAEDGRSYLLYLTELGKETLAKLDALSDDQIRRMLGGLPEPERRSVVKNMRVIEGALSDSAQKVRQVQIRSDLRPGDVGALIGLHGWIYSKECGYNHIFEGYVCKTFSDFFENYSPDKDRFWFAEAEGEIVGAIAIVGHSVEKAQLRWFILHPDFRGLGIGKTLLREAVTYCAEKKKYRLVFLETTEDQKTAIRMYEQAGFRKTAERKNETWGVSHVELVYELRLS